MTGEGDFMVDPEGALVRRPERGLPLSICRCTNSSGKGSCRGPAGPLSLNLIFDRAIEQGRLFGLINDGEWFHIGTAGGLSEAEGYFRQRFQVSGADRHHRWPPVRGRPNPYTPFPPERPSPTY